MGTITISSSGFAALPATAPAGWPVGIVYPGAVAPNGARSATLTDAEMVMLVTWAAAELTTQGSSSAPATVTVAQILVNWVGSFFNGTKGAVQRYFTQPAVPPAQINLN